MNAQEQKKAIEAEINKMIADYEKEHGVMVGSIEVTRWAKPIEAKVTLMVRVEN